VGLASAKAHVENDDGVDIGTGVGEASEDVLKDSMEVACNMCGLEEGGRVVVRRLGSTLSDGGEADGELGLRQRTLDDFWPWCAGFWAPDGGWGHDYQFVLYVRLIKMMYGGAVVP